MLGFRKKQKPECRPALSLLIFGFAFLAFAVFALSPVNFTPLGPAHAQAQYEEEGIYEQRGEGIYETEAEEEWYDPSDWFDGGEIEYEEDWNDYAYGEPYGPEGEQPYGYYGEAEGVHDEYEGIFEEEREYGYYTDEWYEEEEDDWL